MAKTIFITGVSSGIGYGLCKHFLSRGDTVYGCSRRQPGDLGEHPNFHFESIDVSDYEKVRQIIPEFLKTCHHFDLIILNAGVLGAITDIQDAALDEMKRTMEVNLWANKVIIDCLLETKATIKQIVAISSGASRSGNRGWNGYGISKAALNMLIQLYAVELPDIHFCALAPGLVDSGMQEAISKIPSYAQFETVKRLKAAKGTDKMPNPEVAGPMLASAMEKVLKLESGSYADIRHL